MDHPLPGPSSKIRKRATKACLACRARKVRCDVSQRGRPCMNCYLDGESCVVIGRASRRRKSKDDGNDNDNAAADDGSSGRLHGRDSGEPEQSALGQAADGDVLMETPSDGGSERPEMLRDPGRASSAAHMVNDARRPGVQGREPSSHAASTHYAPQSVSSHHHHHHHHQQQQQQQQQHSLTRARVQQLQWAGEQTITFGSDVTYTYYPFLTLSNLPSVLPQDASYLEMQGCLRVPVRTILDEFVKQYFLHVHPIMALLNESDVWEMYSAPPGAAFEPEQQLSLLVWQAVLFSACSYVPRSTLGALGFTDTKTARATFYRRAKLLFDFEAEFSHVAIAQAALLLSSWNPDPSRSRARAGSSWLNIAIEHARLAGAHRATWPVGAAAAATLVGRHGQLDQDDDRALRRLWWCIILHDRVSSLCSRKPIQVTRARFSDLDARGDDPIGPGAVVDETHGSRVYNVETKTSLLGGVFPELLRLAVALTDLLAVVQAPDELPRWDKRYGHEEMEKVRECKVQMKSWYRAASVTFKPPDSRASKKDKNGQGHEEFMHDSIVLYTDLMYLLYHSAMTRLYHFEFLELTKAQRENDPKDGLEADMLSNQVDIRAAASGVVTCLKDLAHHRLLRWLPPDLIGCITLPLILTIIDVKVSSPRRPGPELDDLRRLDELARGFQPHRDMTDWISDAIRAIFDVAQLDDDDAARIPDDGYLADVSSHHQHHPSMYLRLALSLDPAIRYDSSDPIAYLPRLLATDTLRRIAARRKPSSASFSSYSPTTSSRPAPAPAAVPAAAAPDESKTAQLRMAEWMQQDQAISYGVQLGIVPPADMAREDDDERAGAGEGTPASTFGTTMREGDREVEGSAAALAAARENAQAEAEWEDMTAWVFSEAGDCVEGRVLDVFVFRDQPPGTHGLGAAGC